MRNLCLVLLTVPLLLGPAALLAQAPDSARNAHAAAPVAVAVPGTGAITLDGRLTEDAWAAATPVTQFTQTDPVEGEPATERTEVRFLYSGEMLYIGARMYDSGKVSRRLGRRDAYLSDADRFTVTLDSYHDHRTAFRFSINPSGVRGDEAMSNDYWGDDSWDPVWEVETTVDADGWTAEMRIPLSQLRFSRADEQRWGVQLSRWISRKQESVVFAFTPKKERGGIARYGHLVGLEGLKPGKRLELLPYVSSRAEYREVPQQDAFANPYRDGSDFFAGAGLDLKFRVTSNLTLDATINPDFGQVELDPAQINLSAFETYYQEKRPFFVEGAEIFNFGSSGGCFGCPQMFYTRRIGAQPRGLPDWMLYSQRSALYTDYPDATTILGAAKLTGKTAGGWSIGVLEAVTAAERARFITEARENGEAVVEPLTNWFVGRVRRDFRNGQSSIGVLGTAVNRDLSEDYFVQRLRGSAYSAGIDFQHQWANRSWSLSGFLAASTVAGDSGVILAAQRAPARYYQRPDAAHLALNAAARTLNGVTAGLQLGKEAGEHWRGGVSVGTTTPGYEINDFGFQYSTDRIQSSAYLNYSENQPGPVFRRWSARANVGGEWNYGYDRLGTYLSLGGNGQLLNYWNGGFYANARPANLNDRLTRGGPLAASPASGNLSGHLFSDSRKPYTVGLFGGYGWNTAGGWSVYLSPDLGIKTAPNWSLSVGPSFSRSRDVAQYIGSVADSTATATFGRRYLFAPIDQTTLGIGTRLNYTFRPGLTLEGYLEPFLASGAYDDPRQLRAPRTFAFDPYTPPSPVDRDFNYLSLNGSAVARWEWRPSSTLFLVWQQQRGGYYGAFNNPAYPSLGRFNPGRDFGELWDLRPDNVFLLKVNYWLNP